MYKIDKEIEEIKEEQKEYDRRAEVGKEAERLICEGKFLEAKELLDALNEEHSRKEKHSRKQSINTSPARRQVERKYHE